MTPELDAICEPGHLREIVRDEWAVWLVLFAEAIPRGQDAIELRRREWVALFGDPDTGVIAGELRFQRRQVVEGGRRQLPEFGVALRQRAAADAEHFCDLRVEQAFAQRTLADHTAGTENYHSHHLFS